MRRDAKRILNFSSGKIDWILNGENGTVGHKENVEGFVIVKGTKRVQTREGENRTRIGNEFECDAKCQDSVTLTDGSPWEEMNGCQ